MLQVKHLGSTDLKIDFFIGVLFWIDTRLAVIFLVVVPLFWFIGRRFATRVKALARERRVRDGAVTMILEESLGNAPLVPSYNGQGAAAAGFARETESVMLTQFALERLRAGYAPFVSLIEVGGMLIVIGGGAGHRAGRAATRRDRTGESGVAGSRCPRLRRTRMRGDRLRRPGATDEENVAAARMVGAREFIERLPEGYDTRVGQRGRSLSGGQSLALESRRSEVGGRRSKKSCGVERARRKVMSRDLRRAGVLA